MKQYQLNLSREEILWLEKYLFSHGIGHLEAHNIYDKIIVLRQKYDIGHDCNIDRYSNNNINSTLDVNIQYVISKN